MTEEKEEVEPPDLRIKEMCVLYHGAAINGNPTIRIPYDNLRHDPQAGVIDVRGRLSYLKPLNARVLGLFESDQSCNLSGMYAEELGISIDLKDLKRLPMFTASEEQKTLLNSLRAFRLRDPHPSYEVK